MASKAKELWYYHQSTRINPQFLAVLHDIVSYIYLVQGIIVLELEPFPDLFRGGEARSSFFSSRSLSELKEKTIQARLLLHSRHA
jgi:hypothetical protein